MKKAHILTIFFFVAGLLTLNAQENVDLAKATTKKLVGKWLQTEQSNIKGEKKPANSTLIFDKTTTYSWLSKEEKKRETGNWKADNYSKNSNMGKTMELVNLQTKDGKKKTSLFINQLTDSTLVLRSYDYSKGAPAKDDFIDLHFKRAATGPRAD